VQAASVLDWVASLDRTVLRATRELPGWTAFGFYVFTVIGAGWGLFALVPPLFLCQHRRATLWLWAAAPSRSARRARSSLPPPRAARAPRGNTVGRRNCRSALLLLSWRMRFVPSSSTMAIDRIGENMTGDSI
jgi:hypothetical protein